MQGLLGHAGEADIEAVKKEWGALLSPGEEIKRAYTLVRDKIIMTQKRIIFINVKGLTGKQIEIFSAPYRSLIGYSIQTAGVLDLSAELFIYVASRPEPITYKFSNNVNIYEVQAILSDAIANNGL